MAIFSKKLLIILISLVCGGQSFAKVHKNKRAVLVFDDQTGKILHQEHANEPRHPASLTKKMALYIVFRALKSGKIQFNTLYPVSKRAAGQEPCSAGYRVGERHMVIDYIKAGVTQSANDGMVALAEGVGGSVENFVSQMNATAKELGMARTVFYNPTGLPHPQQFTTANDMLILAKALVRDFPEYYRFFKTVNYSYQGRNFRNHNRMLGAVPGMDGIKTGFVNASGFNVSTSTMRNGRRVYVVFMGGSSWRARDAEVVNFIEAAFRQPVGVASMESLAPKGTPTTDELNTPHVDKEPLLMDVKASSPENDAFGAYLNGVANQDALHTKLLKVQNKAVSGKYKVSPKIVSLSSIKELGGGKFVKAVLHKPVKGKKVKKACKRRRA